MFGHQVFQAHRQVLVARELVEAFFVDSFGFLEALEIMQGFGLATVGLDKVGIKRQALVGILQRFEAVAFEVIGQTAIRVELRVVGVRRNSLTVDLDGFINLALRNELVAVGVVLLNQKIRTA
jgi:hypothetical protein